MNSMNLVVSCAGCRQVGRVRVLYHGAAPLPDWLDNLKILGLTNSEPGNAVRIRASPGWAMSIDIDDNKCIYVKFLCPDCC